MHVEKWLQSHTSSLEGKRIAVTGSTGGLGQELCRYLCELGASLILLNRNAERTQLQIESLRGLYPDAQIDTLILDLESPCSAVEVCDRLIEKEIDIFIHNAGAYKIPRRICENGYDNVFTINFATPYWMIRRLLPMLRERGGRVVIVGSIAHRYSKTDPEDVDFQNKKSAAKVYGNAKRYLMFSLSELFRNETAATLSITHPGISFTNITAHYPKLIFAIIKHPMKVIFMHPRKASLSILRGVFEPTSAEEWIGPRFFDIWGMPKKKALHTCKTTERQSIAEIAEHVYATHAYPVKPQGEKR